MGLHVEVCDDSVTCRWRRCLWHLSHTASWSPCPMWEWQTQLQFSCKVLTSYNASKLLEWLFSIDWIMIQMVCNASISLIDMITLVRMFLWNDTCITLRVVIVISPGVRSAPAFYYRCKKRLYITAVVIWWRVIRIVLRLRIGVIL